MNQEILACVFRAIDEANEDREDHPPLQRSLDTSIYGTESGLDSLGLINFLAAVEEGVEEELGATIVLSDEEALAREPSPFESVRTLVDYIEGRLRERS